MTDKDWAEDRMIRLVNAEWSLVNLVKVATEEDTDVITRLKICLHRLRQSSLLIDANTVDLTPFPLPSGTQPDIMMPKAGKLPPMDAGPLKRGRKPKGRFLI